jgi:uncharacterized protein (DUF1800 family)
MQSGVEAWVDSQFNAPSAYDSDADAHLTHLQRTQAIAAAMDNTITWVQTHEGAQVFNVEASGNVQHYQMSSWWENALAGQPDNPAHGADQLRQRVAYALSQIVVTSSSEKPLNARGESLAHYYDILARNAFGNYRDLLREVTLSPAMGTFLSHRGNSKATADNGPDENFARELMQLFTIGLYQLNIDGSPDRDGNPQSYPDAGDNLLPAYTQQDVEELAKVMTGWSLDNLATFQRIAAKHGNYTVPMKFYPEHHEDEILEGGDGQVTVLGQTINLAAIDHDGNPSGLDAALDVIFNHPNVGPFIATNLIHRLVTSNPSSAYVARVAQAFNDNGAGERGDLKAVVRAILLDPEARGDYSTDPGYGKVREPLLALTQLLRNFSTEPVNGWRGYDNRTVNSVYWFSEVDKVLDQGPLRSNSVFNFYSEDYVPSDTYFASERLIAPEMQIQADQQLLGYNNLVADLLAGPDISVTSGLNHRMFLQLNLERELKLFEQAMDGDQNGDFSNFDTNLEPAVDALLDHLDTVMLANRMTAEFRAALKHYLLNGFGVSDAYKDTVNSADPDVARAEQIIKDAIHMIATSSSYMILK